MVNTPRTPQGERRGFRILSAFRNPGYRLLWPANLFSSMGRWMQLTLLSWLVLVLTDSPLKVAMVGFFGMVPMLVLGILGGVLADRMNRRRLLIATQSVSFVACAAMAVVLFLGLERFWYAYLVVLVSGTGSALDMPSRRSIEFDLLGRSGVTNGVALDSVGMHSSKMFGPLLAGVLIALLDVAGGYAFVTGLYLSSAFLMRRLKVPDAKVSDGRPHDIVANLMEGFRYVRRNNTLLGVVLVTVFMNLLLFPYMQMVPVVAKNVLDVGPGLMGLLMAAPGLGALIGAVMIASATGLRYHGRVFLGGSALGLLALIVFSLSRSYPASLVVVVIVGLGTAGFGTMQSTMAMLAASDEMRGRALGVVSLAIGAGPIGAILIGAIASAGSAPFAIGLFAVLGLVSLAVVIALMPILWRRTSEQAEQAVRPRMSPAPPPE